MQPTMEQRLAVRDRPGDQMQVMYQSWKDLLFLHWAVPAKEVQKNLPSGLSVDTWQGNAYLGIVPFLMRNIRPRFCPAIPGISNFHEINLRTYVFDRHGNPGVWFYSLDADQWLAVRTARTLFRLPYFDAKMSFTKTEEGKVVYRSQRRKQQQTESKFEYRIGHPMAEAAPDSFEFFLAERYLLFAPGKGQKMFSGQVYHTPYPLFSVEVTEFDTQLFALAGFESPNRPPDHSLFSPGVDVDVFYIKAIQ